MKAAISIASLNRMLQPLGTGIDLAGFTVARSERSRLRQCGRQLGARGHCGHPVPRECPRLHRDPTVHGKKITRRPLSQLVEELEALGILRIHRSMAVNLRRVEGFDSHSVRLGSEECAISNSYKKQVKERMRSI